MVHGAESGEDPHGQITTTALNTSHDDLSREHAVKSFTQHLEVTHQGPQVTWIVFDEQVQGIAVEGHAFFTQHTTRNSTDGIVGHPVEVERQHVPRKTVTGGAPV